MNRSTEPANQDQVILPSIEGKLRKNALCLNQSAFSNFALYVIKPVMFSYNQAVWILARWLVQGYVQS